MKGNMADAEKVLEANKIVLKDRQGRVRIELAAESVRVEPANPADPEDEALVLPGSELIFYTAEGKRRLSLGVYDGETSDNGSFLADVVMYDKTERQVIGVEGYSRDGRVTFKNRQGEISLSLGFTQFDDEARPEIILAGRNGWRMMLTVGQDQPHLAFYDAANLARLHLTVDRSGKPHVRRYFWRWLVPAWRWIGYYPRDGARR
jgi:hypothetical protein